MGLTEKLAYIKGLMKGLKLDESKDENKVLTALVDLLEDVTLSIEDLEEYADEVGELLDIMDEDLGEVEDAVFEDEDGCGCGSCDCDHEFDDDLFEIVCPTCHEEICLDEAMLDEESISCPNCGQSLGFELDEEADPD